jgi:DNA-binding response OmpR family regulator
VDPESKVVLIVDDEAEIRTFLADLLTAHGYRCFWVDSGRDALAQINNIKPDLVLLDVMMPGLSGIETLRLIKKRPEVDAAVVMISCLSHPNTTLRAMDEGADHFVVKPFRMHEIIATVERVLNERAGAADMAQPTLPG